MPTKVCQKMALRALFRTSVWFAAFDAFETFDSFEILVCLFKNDTFGTTYTGRNSYSHQDPFIRSRSDPIR